MGEAITTRPGAKWTSVIKPEVTRGETCKLRVVLKASDDVAWTGTTATERGLVEQYVKRRFPGLVQF